MFSPKVILRLAFSVFAKILKYRDTDIHFFSISLIVSQLGISTPSNYINCLLFNTNIPHFFILNSIPIFFFSIRVFFYEHSWFTGQQGKGKAIFLSTPYQFHPLHKHLDISRVITSESSPLHIASSRTRTGNLWFTSASH